MLVILFLTRLGLRWPPAWLLVLGVWAVLLLELFAALDGSIMCLACSR